MVSSQKVPRSVLTCTHCQHEVVYTHHAPPKPYEDHQLRAGQVPSRRHTRSAMKQAKAQLRVVQEEVQKMSTALAILKSMEGELREVVARQRTYLAPIRRLPVELLVEIFKWSCIQEITDYPWASYSSGPFSFTALEISSVCRLWRGACLYIPSRPQLNIMHDNPCVWAQMSMPGASHLQDPHRVFLKRLDLCFKAMRGLPLVQRIVAHPHALSVTAEYTSQWQDVRLPHAEFNILRRLNDRPYPHLHTLSFDVQHFTQDMDPDEECDDIDAFLDAPALRRVRLTNETESSVVPHLPWANLLSLRTTSTYAYALTLLAKCKSLRHWEHSEVVTENEDDPPVLPIPVMLPCLQSMRIVDLDMQVSPIMDNNSDGAVWTLDYITAPAVTKLQLYGPEPDAPSPVYAGPYLASFLARSNCPLRELTLFDMRASERTYVPTHCDIHTFEYAAMEDAPLSDLDLARFAALDSNGKPLLWPNLKILVFLGQNHFRAEAVVEIVAARCSAGCPLQRLYIDNSTSSVPGKDAMRKLRSLVPDFSW
ncbi:hypothetical protein EV715DRAFT_207045 [Schizophyllum commune]